MNYPVYLDKLLLGENMGFLSSKSKKTEVIVKKREVVYGKNIDKTNRADRIDKTDKTTFIGRTIKIKGKVTARENMVVEGQINGDIDISKTLTVERNGMVDADVKANSVKIKGRVKGRVNAMDRIEILNNGICEGNILTDKLIVKEGAILIGTINIEKESVDNTNENATVVDNETEVIEGVVIDKTEEDFSNSEIIKDVSNDEIDVNKIDENKIDENKIDVNENKEDNLQVYDLGNTRELFNSVEILIFEPN